ncbi:MAG: 3'-phosphoesterase [Candidatus Brockarchaeota archaeon]|nr:3'-phosphoesterase [Candidatus Brockarchaeota archaeon]
MGLKEYRRKRDFSKTAEPPGGEVGKGGGGEGVFVVQEHRATHLHWDFRLAMDGVLKSWAVPKEPPTTPGIRRLAVQVEDHPLDYADFEGTIPEGEYGAGSVKIWDKGTYEMKERKGGKLLFSLQGKKMKGDYCLLKFEKAGGKNWLLFAVKSTAPKAGKAS